MIIGSTIHRLPSCSSTNDVAMALAREGAEEGTIVIAAEQTAGRGTKGREWHSPAWKGLYASVILRPQQRDLSLLPVIAGIAAVEAIQKAAGIDVRLKWPNDIVRGRRKLGGILCESSWSGSSPTFAVLGIGINVSQRRGDFPPELRTRATSLRLAGWKAANPAALETSLWTRLDVWYGAFENGEAVAIVSAFESYLSIPIGKLIKVVTEGAVLAGVLAGIDTRARLILTDARGEHRLPPAEILDVKSPPAGRRKQGEAEHAPGD